MHQKTLAQMHILQIIYRITEPQYSDQIYLHCINVEKS